jgi:hypothetical protein
MPGPDSTFKEACELRSGVGNGSGPLGIIIWGDDPDFLAILLYALHFRAEKVPRAVSFVQLWELAILCDKYDCASAMAPWIALWTRGPPQLEGNFSQCLVKWIFMAWVFDRDDLFRGVTRAIILEGRYYGMIPSDMHFAMPSYINLSETRFSIPEFVLCKPITHPMLPDQPR